jgi:hypothetical protein
LQAVDLADDDDFHTARRALLGAAGLPFSGAAGRELSSVSGRFMPAPQDPMHPGKAFVLIRAAFRAPAPVASDQS